MLRLSAAAHFDAHGLFADMLANPGLYLNGTAPLNTTSDVGTCKVTGRCANDSEQDSYLW